MEIVLRAALITWLRADPALAALNAIAEEAPNRTSLPWLGLVASASTDWSTKDRAGREIRIALELQARGDDPLSAADLVTAVEERIAAFPPDLSSEPLGERPAFRIINCRFLRARAEQRSHNRRAVLLEYRFRCLAYGDSA
ncbi:DUF3168 domain-containing protein [Altericroceibacterium endophyticum]|uniref:DUF3168 domain-containing protein n=1 Tax=Altericroceibacterium endophyticum TaxID=1808508 RepID=A0A6I4T6Q7_9SPHN|nr:DUF3168 domain-containing protein [Altericroceibacterium endophyticum]MXO65495.1 DUF3168 domain-containing protein [Altericroceibacterium endophyticum]